LRVVMDYVREKQRKASKEKSFPTFITIRKLVPTKFMMEYSNWIHSNLHKDNIHSFFRWLEIKWKCTLELSEDKHPVSTKAPLKGIKPKQFLVQNSETQSEEPELQDETGSEEEAELTVESQEEEVSAAVNRPSFKPRYTKKEASLSKRPSAHEHKVDQLSIPKCDFCKTERHYLSQCDKFEKADSLQKLEHMKEHKLCWHCLRPGHFINKCRVNVGKVCGIDGCQRKHHPLVHPPISKSRGLYIEDILIEFFGIKESESGRNAGSNPTQD